MMIRAITYIIALAIATTTITSPAFAHQLPAVLGVVDNDDGGLQSVRISHGLAMRDAKGRFRFVCPHRWEGPDTPLAMAAAGSSWVVGNNQLFRFERDGSSIAVPAASVSVMTTRRLVRTDSAVYALTVENQTSTIWRFSGSEAMAIHQTSDVLHSIAIHDGTLLAAMPHATGVRILSFGLDGAPRGEQIAAHAEAMGTTITLEVAGTELFAVLRTARMTVVGAVRNGILESIAESPSPISGPVLAGDTLMIIIDGALLRVKPAGLEPVDQSRRYTCLDGDSRGPYVCVLTRLYSLLPGGEVGPLGFELGEVKGPQLAGLSAGSRIACEIEWMDLAAEAQLDPTIPTDETSMDAGTEPVPEPQSCACVASPPLKDTPPFFLLVLISLTALGYIQRVRTPLIALTIALALATTLSACSSVRFNDKERLLKDRTMAFDHDSLHIEMRGHVLTPREAAMGGFTGTVGAGGCGCN